MILTPMEFTIAMPRLSVIVVLSLLTAQSALADDGLHWAFRPTAQAAVPIVERDARVRTTLDCFILSRLEQQRIALGPAADRATLLRRLSFDLVGLPPTPDEVAAFVADSSPIAYQRAVERMLASPHYGERWGKLWLDAAGYADSNGYFNADTDRPLAYKYRDYVIQVFNADMPYDRFVREQLAGDELSGYSPGGPVTPQMIELLTATHFLRNAQDGTSESDGNPDEVTIDRATVLEGTLQITMNTLLGITIQCCRCHEHKFEPIEHTEYYQLQSVFYPAFPFFHRDKWVGPKDRVSHVASPAAMAAWENKQRQLTTKIAELRGGFRKWIMANRPPSLVRFQDDFNNPKAKLGSLWSNTAPGDDAPGGKPVVNIDSAKAPGARIHNAALELLESGGSGNRWLSTKAAIDWTPEKKDQWVQVTFDLISDKSSKGGTAAARIGYYIALNDFDDSGSVQGGNILIDGNPAGGADVHSDYPGRDSQNIGSIGKRGYRSGSNYGVRITNMGGDKFRVEQLVDLIPEEKSVTLTLADLPDGGFGFEFCCGRSFIVDNVIVEGIRSAAPSQPQAEMASVFQREYQKRRNKLNAAIKALDTQRSKKPGKLAWVTDLMSPAPEVHLLERGLYAHPGTKVRPSGLAVLTDDGSKFQLPQLPSNVKSSGRRLAFANWLTRPNSRPAALLARVMVNRIWQHHFGRGIVVTPDNLGQSGAEPSHPKLLDYLADEFISSGWSVKAMHRLIVHSAVYQQSSVRRDLPIQADPENQLLWRYSLRRLDAEAVRDAMLAASGELDVRLFGPYIPIKTLSDGNVVVDENHSGARRRGLYLQQRRTRMNSLLSLFDAPSMVSTCGKRSTSTVPLQSLALLNSTFVRNRASALASRVLREIPKGDELRIQRAFRLAYGRDPEAAERDAAIAFLKTQTEIYAKRVDRDKQAMIDLCQMLFASSAFLYLE